MPVEGKGDDEGTRPYLEPTGGGDNYEVMALEYNLVKMVKIGKELGGGKGETTTNHMPLRNQNYFMPIDRSLGFLPQT